MSGVDDKETGSLLWKLEPPLGATEQESNLAFEQQEGSQAGARDMTGYRSPRALSAFKECISTAGPLGRAGVGKEMCI